MRERELARLADAKPDRQLPGMEPFVQLLDHQSHDVDHGIQPIDFLDQGEQDSLTIVSLAEEQLIERTVVHPSTRDFGRTLRGEYVCILSRSNAGKAR